nr:hypothetical protein [Thiocystis minor]
MQYALVDRAVELGWSTSRILLIDEDLGRSGASAEGRPGFQRLMAESRSGSCRHRSWHRDLALGTQLAGLLSIARSLRTVCDTDRGCRRGL